MTTSWFNGFELDRTSASDDVADGAGLAPAISFRKTSADPTVH
jgi:hypothetical protein